MVVAEACEGAVVVSDGVVGAADGGAVGAGAAAAAAAGVSVGAVSGGFVDAGAGAAFGCEMKERRQVLDLKM